MNLVANEKLVFWGLNSQKVQKEEEWRKITLFCTNHKIKYVS